MVVEDYNLIFLKKLKEKLLNSCHLKAIDLAHGNVEDFSQYKQMCGVIQGLDLALNIAETVYEEITKEERE